MPVEADEIAGPPALFERLDVVPEIGQKFQIPLRIQGGKVENYDFTITGILEQTDISKLNVNETRVSDYITAPVNIPELIRRILFFVE